MWRIRRIFLLPHIPSKQRIKRRCPAAFLLFPADCLTISFPLRLVSPSVLPCAFGRAMKSLEIKHCPLILEDRNNAAFDQCVTPKPAAQSQSEIVSSSGQKPQPAEVVTIPGLVTAINGTAEEEDKETSELKHWILRQPMYAGFFSKRAPANYWIEKGGKVTPCSNTTSIQKAEAEVHCSGVAATGRGGLFICNYTGSPSARSD